MSYVTKYMCADPDTINTVNIFFLWNNAPTFLDNFKCWRGGSWNECIPAARHLPNDTRKNEKDETVFMTTSRQSMRKKEK